MTLLSNFSGLKIDASKFVKKFLLLIWKFSVIFSVHIQRPLVGTLFPVAFENIYHFLDDKLQKLVNEKETLIASWRNPKLPETL